MSSLGGACSHALVALAFRAPRYRLGELSDRPLPFGRRFMRRPVSRRTTALRPTMSRRGAARALWTIGGIAVGVLLSASTSKPRPGPKMSPAEGSVVSGTPQPRAGSSADLGMRAIHERVTSQSAYHWTEFASIVAGGNLAAAVLSLGLVLFGSHGTLEETLFVVTIIASLVAVLLAYFSIHGGSAATVGAIGLLEVVNSLAIAGAQVGMFLIVASTADKSDLSEAQTVERLRYWLLMAAVFALAGAVANYLGTRRRRSWRAKFVSEGCSPIEAPLDAYEACQSKDRLAASVAGIVTLAAFGGSSFPITAWVLLTAIVLYTLGMVPALLNQEKAAKCLETAALVHTETRDER